MKRYNLTLTHGNDPNHPTPATIESAHGEWVRYEDVNALALQLEAMSSPTLPKIIAALGWQGGTVEQVVAEVARLKALEPYTIGKPVLVDGWGHEWAAGEIIAYSNVGGKVATATNRDHCKPIGQGVAALLPEHEANK